MFSARWRAFVAIAIVFSVSSVLLYLSSTILVQSQFSKIEINDAEQNTGRAVDALQEQVSNLAVKSSDWSNWDDTYKYIVDRNQAYVDSNLQNGSIANLGINFMLFYDVRHTLVYAKGIDAAGHDLKVPADLIGDFGVKSKLFSDQVDQLHKGFLTVDNQALMFAARPILTSDASGPVHGTLVFAQFLTNDGIEKLANVTHLSLQFFPVSVALPPDTADVRSQLTSKNVTVRPLSDSQIAGYTLVDDITGKPVLVTRVVMERQAFIEAQKSVRYFLITIAGISLLSIFFVIYVTNQVQARDKVIRLKDEFFSIASHELRTPLTAIRGNGRLLQEHYGAANDKIFQELVGDIIESSVRLIRMVNNFLDAARFEKGKVPLSLSALSLNDVSQAVVKELQGLARDKNIYIKAEVSDDLPEVYADRDRVTQIIYNLIGNAAKFTDQGGVTVTAEAIGTMAKVYITDTGRGISPEGQKILFQKFQQVKQSDSRNGSGLGLYISKMLVELMGGRIGLERSEEGVGTTLSFSLPLASLDQIAAAKKAAK